jgi:hypothetical protein
MRHAYIQQSQQEIEYPACLSCGAPMWLIRVEPNDRVTSRGTEAGLRTNERMRVSVRQLRIPFGSAPTWREVEDRPQ